MNAFATLSQQSIRSLVDLCENELSTLSPFNANDSIRRADIAQALRTLREMQSPMRDMTACVSPQAMAVSA